VKSLYVKLSLWSFLMIVFCFIAFVATSFLLSSRMQRRGDFYGRITSWQFDMARRAHEQGGRPALQAFMADLHAHFQPAHYLLDAQNRDLLTGEDRSELAQQGTNGMPPLMPGGRMVITRSSDDGKYRYIVAVEPPTAGWNIFPYFAIVLGAVAVLSYFLFRYLVSPLRQLASAVERFGQGDFSARVKIRRNDEYGVVADRFNEMADRLQTLLAAERRLLEDVSHELRSPLARLQFALELVRTAPDRETAVARMRRELGRLSDLVGQLMEVTRAEGDPGARARERVDLVQLATEIVEDCRIEAEARHCSIQLDSATALPLFADRELLRRALENVLRNAIRYSPEGSQIEMALSQQAQAAAIQIRDFGPGVPEAMLDKIFEPFFRVDGSRDAATGGVGLGLAIARRAVSLHQGKLSARNASPGLQVSMEFPLLA
jgi:signal transduction histidine kinase